MRLLGLALSEDRSIILNKQNFPSYFPPGCPPEDSFIPHNDVVYRILDGNPPTENDFRTYFELRKAEDSDSVLKYGLSVIKELEGVAEACKRIPKMRKEKFVAKLLLDESSGRLKHTPAQITSMHYTWWIYEGVDALEYVKEVIKVS